MDQLGAGRGGMRGKVVLLDKRHRQAPACGVPGDTRAIDASAHDEEVDRLRLLGIEHRRSALPFRTPSRGLFVQALFGPRHVRHAIATPMTTCSDGAVIDTPMNALPNRTLEFFPVVRRLRRARGLLSGTGRVGDGAGGPRGGAAV